MNATLKFHDSMCFGHMCKRYGKWALGAFGLKRFQARHGMKKTNFNFSNQECSLPQDDLTFEGHTSFFKSTCKFTCVKYKHRHLCHSKISIGLKLYWLCINNPKIWATCNHKSSLRDFSFSLWMTRTLVLIVCTFSLIIYFALF